MNKMVETIELINKNNICLIKIGNFYHVYGRDSYILSYLFNYKIDMIKHECGFPVVSLNKVLAKLEEEKINYLVIDKRNNYSVDMQQTFKDLNKYENVYNKSRVFVNSKLRIDNIYEKLIENVNKKNFQKTLGEIERIINERREVQSNSAN